MEEIQCTLWLEKNSNLRFGKVYFPNDDKTKLTKAWFNVPKPVRIVKAEEWCKKHATFVGGYIRELNSRIAVFRKVRKGFLKRTAEGGL